MNDQFPMTNGLLHGVLPTAAVGHRSLQHWAFTGHWSLGHWALTIIIIPWSFALLSAPNPALIPEIIQHEPSREMHCCIHPASAGGNRSLAARIGHRAFATNGQRPGASDRAACHPIP